MKGFFLGGFKGSTNKEQILAKVRNAILEKDENRFTDINLQNDTWMPFRKEDGDEFTFIERFKENGSIFMYFESIKHFKEAIKQFVDENRWSSLLSTSPKIKEIFSGNDIEIADDYKIPRNKIVSLIDCECMIAQTGSVMVSDVTAGSRAAFSFADILLIYATPTQFVSKMKDAFQLIKEKYDNDIPSEISIISGPSRSTDIGNTLVIGALGTKQVALFLVEED